MITTVGEKGQITIPKSLRDSLGIFPGQKVEVQEQAGSLILQPVIEMDPLLRLVGSAQIKESQNSDKLLNEMRGEPYNPKLDGPRR